MICPNDFRIFGQFCLDVSVFFRVVVQKSPSFCQHLSENLDKTATAQISTKQTCEPAADSSHSLLVTEKRGLASGGYWGKLEVENEICGEVWHINYGLGERIRKARVRAGLTQSQLAEMIGMTNKHLSTVERGMFELHADAVRQISEVLGVSADYLIFDERRNSPLDEALLKAHLLPEEVQDEAADVIEAFMAIQMVRKEVAKEDSSDEE